MEIPKVYAAISAVMAVMAKEGISKDRKNQQQGYNFRGIDDVYNALGKVMAENGLVILPRVVAKEREERTTSKGGMLMYTVLTVEFDLVSSEDGSKHTVCMVGEAMDSADKSSNKAQSAALKYAALQVFMIPTEGDNDADATTHEVSSNHGKADAQKQPTKNDAARGVYDALQKQMRGIKTAKELAEWWTDPECKEKRSALPEDWAKNLYEEFAAQGKELKAKEANEKFPGDE